MMRTRRMTIDPPLTDAEFARFCAANPGMEIDRDASGVIIMSRRLERRDDYVDWLLSQRGTVSADMNLDADMSGVGSEMRRSAQDKENLRALGVLRDRTTFLTFLPIAFLLDFVSTAVQIRTWGPVEAAREVGCPPGSISLRISASTPGSSSIQREPSNSAFR